MKFEVPLTEGNFGKDKPTYHLYIDSFAHHLPPDIIGGSKKTSPAPKLMTLEYDGRTCRTDIPSEEKSGKPRRFFRARGFIGDFFRHTGARPGDVVVFELVAPYHLKLSLKR